MCHYVPQQRNSTATLLQSLFQANSLTHRLMPKRATALAVSTCFNGQQPVPADRSSRVTRLALLLREGNKNAPCPSAQCPSARKQELQPGRVCRCLDHLAALFRNFPPPRKTKTKTTRLAKGRCHGVPRSGTEWRGVIGVSDCLSPT